MHILHVFESVEINGISNLVKLDTGAFSSSIDQKSVDIMGLEAYVDGKTITIRSASGVQVRKRVKGTVTFHPDEGEPIVREIIFNVTDRSDMKFSVIIGRRDLEGIAVLVTPDAADPDNPTNITRR